MISVVECLALSAIPKRVTIALAILVAVSRSLAAPATQEGGRVQKRREGFQCWYIHKHSSITFSLPLVTFSVPKTISSATLPPIATSSLAINCFLLHDNSSFSDNIDTMPRALPRGTMVALWIGSAPEVMSKYVKFRPLSCS